MYRSPNSAPENNEKLCEELRTLRKRYDTMLIMGDLNFRNINWEQNSTPGGDTTSCDHRFLESIKDCFMYQHVTQPTRGRGEDAPSLLDLILTNEQEMVSALKYISPLGKSDHAVLQFTCCFRGVAKPSNSLLLKKCYNKADYVSMREKVKKT